MLPPSSTMRTHRSKEAGMGLLELTIALAIFGAGILVVVQMMGASAEAGRRQNAKAQAVQAADTVTARLTEEVSQTADNTSAATGARVALVDAGRGVQFRRIIGTRIVAGAVITDWSVPVKIFWTPADGTVRRQVGDRDPTLVARGVTNFLAAVHPNGSIVVDVESRRRKGAGPGQLHRSRIRVKPRN